MRQAVLYVPGCFQHLIDQSGGVIAEAIAWSLQDELAPEAPFRYRITVESDARVFSSGIAVDRFSIERIDGDAAEGDAAEGDAAKPVLDLFELKYLPQLVKPFSELSTLGRALRAGRSVAANLPAAMRAIWRRGTPKIRLDKLQGTYLGLLILVSLASLAYWVLLGLTAILGAEELAGESESGDGKTLAVVATLTAVLTIAGRAFKTQIDSFERSAVDFYTIVEYIGDDRPFAPVQNAIADTLSFIGEGDYETIDVMAFSLGCVLAGDAIFPRGTRLRSAAPTVRSWITIGHPYDLIASTHPDYFAQRRGPAVTFAQWINVVAAADFLGSNFRRDLPQENFRDDDFDDRPPDGTLGMSVAGTTAVRAPDMNLFFRPEHRVARSLLDWIPFWRVLNHALYWDGRNPRRPSSFSAIARHAGWLNTD